MKILHAIEVNPVQMHQRWVTDAGCSGSVCVEQTSQKSPVQGVMVVNNQHVSWVLCVVDTECSGSVCGVNVAEEPRTGSDGCKKQQ